MSGPPDNTQFDLFRGVLRAPEPATAQATAPVPSPAGAEAERLLPDAAERRRIAQDLRANLLVEAGAGAGKTTQMVERMVALVRSGVRVDRIAAVTFTRKAAAELRERFQTGLEMALRAAHPTNAPLAVALHARATAGAGGADGPVRDVAGEGEEGAPVRDATDVAYTLDRALREIDRAFIGTIHSFCARLLRERPLEAGVDPDFRETFTVEQERLKHEYFATHVERLAAAGDELLADLARVGLRPDQLRKLFDQLTEHADVTFAAPEAPRPDPAAARRLLSELLDEALTLLPDRQPERGWDELQSTIRRLRFYRNVVGWNDDVRFLHGLAETLASAPRPVFRRWGAQSQRDVRRVSQQLRDYAGPQGEGGRVLRQWWAHRYPIALRFARGAAQAFEHERLRTGALAFQDLLLSTRKLLRDSPNARIELGERYRHVLVDEFQDTDPVQAEVLFLLASPPDSGPAGDWRLAVPREGALFVVGDPKQSIYRFRRADITTYNQVKRRFQEFGGVVKLTANFRSRPAIEKLVDSVFRQRFPAEATAEQAAFAPLQVQKREQPGRVFSYRLVKTSDRPRQDELAAQDAARVGSWIETRIRSGERRPGDFLVLTRLKKHLIAYAREIEARNLPVQVTGGGVGIEEEVAELRMLLSALADPGNPMRLVAVLTGLFFGLDFEQLAAHVLDRAGRLDFTDLPSSPATEVEHALAALHAYWRLAKEEPADIVVATIVYEMGLLPYAAAGELGESRAGALLFVLEAVRVAALGGDASLEGAIIAIDAALDAREAEAPLEPGRDDVIRVMNLHQAKGLESDIVLLVSPFGEREPVPALHVRRQESGSAEGWILVTESRRRWNDTVLARPADWDEHESAELAFGRAEADRLLYVAATRAREELGVARYDEPVQSPWSLFYGFLDTEFEQLDFTIEPQPPRARLEASAEDVTSQVARTDERRKALATPGYRAAAVRTRVKGDAAAAPEAIVLRPINADDDGMAWGKLVHGALEAAGRGRTDSELRDACRALLLASEDRPVDAHGEPLELDPLLNVVASVTRSAVWQRARAAARMLVEVPFALALPAQEYADAFVPADAAGKAPTEVIDGVIDLIFREDGGWIVVDYKSDRAGGNVDATTKAQYRSQVDLYGRCWARLTGEPVAQCMILFTADGSTLSW